MNFKLSELLEEKGYIRGPFGSALKRGEMKEEGIPVYEQQNAIYDNREFRYYIDEEKFEILRRFQVKTDDLIISCSGTVGRVSLIREDEPKGIISQALLILRPNTKKILPRYLKYFFESSKGYNAIISRSTGSVQVNIAKREIIEAIQLQVPKLQEQQKVINILSSLDEKIELNNQMNKTLEEMAQTLFKRWFVDFEFPNEEGEPYKSSGGEMVESELGMIPKGWQVGCLGDIANITMGQSPKGSSYNELGEGEVFYQGRAEFGSRFPKRRLYTSEPKRMANKGDILMSVRAPVGDLNVAYEKCCIGRGLSAIQSKYDCNSFILYTMFNQREQLNIFNGEGTVFGSINKDGLNNLRVLIPSQNIVKSYENMVSKVDKIIENNYDELCNLQQLRDTLLPKLMSGEIRVTDLQN